MASLVCATCRKLIPPGTSAIRCTVASCNTGRMKLRFLLRHVLGETHPHRSAPQCGIHHREAARLTVAVIVFAKFAPRDILVTACDQGPASRSSSRCAAARHGRHLARCRARLSMSRATISTSHEAAAAAATPGSPIAQPVTPFGGRSSPALAASGALVDGVKFTGRPAAGELAAHTGAPGVKLNHGGTSLSLRIDFAGGARAAFKPEQTHPQSDPRRREIAAYRIDRLLWHRTRRAREGCAVHVVDLIAATEPTVRRSTPAGRMRRPGDRHWRHRTRRSGGFRRSATSMIGKRTASTRNKGIALWTSYLQVNAADPAGGPKPLVEQLATVRRSTTW